MGPLAEDRPDNPGADSKGSQEEENQQAINHHIAMLKGGDKDHREMAAEMLGLLCAAEAVPNLLEALHDSDLFVKLKAHGALNKITGKNFGYKNRKTWKEWWGI